MILATNPNVEGEATALYLARLLKPLGVRVTRIATGIPVGTDLEDADEVTMTRPWKAGGSSDCCRCRISCPRRSPPAPGRHRGVLLRIPAVPARAGDLRVHPGRAVRRELDLLSPQDTALMVIFAILGGLGGAAVLIAGYFVGVALVGAGLGAVIANLAFSLQRALCRRWSSVSPWPAPWAPSTSSATSSSSAPHSAARGRSSWARWPWPAIGRALGGRVSGQRVGGVSARSRAGAALGAVRVVRPRHRRDDRPVLPHREATGQEGLAPIGLPPRFLLPPHAGAARARIRPPALSLSPLDAARATSSLSIGRGVWRPADLFLSVTRGHHGPRLRVGDAWPAGPGPHV